MRPVVEEGGRDVAHVVCVDDLSCRSGEVAAPGILGRRFGEASVQSVGCVGGGVEMDHILAGTIAVVVVHIVMGLVLIFQG